MPKIFISFALLPILFFEVFLVWQNFWGEKVLPRISVGEILLAGKTQTEADKTLKSVISNLKTVKVQVSDQTFEIPVQDLNLEFKVEKTVQDAYSIGHSINLLANIAQAVNIIKSPVKLKVSFSLDEIKLDESLANLSQKFDTEIIESKLEVKDRKIKFTPGKAGQKLDRETIKKQIFVNFSQLNTEPVTAQVLTIQPEIPQEQGFQAIQAGEKFVSKKIIMTVQNQNFEIGENEILVLVSPDINSQNFDLVGNKIKIEEFVKNNLDKKISVLPVDAKFYFDGKKVTVFTPSVDGVKLDTQKTSNLIFEALNNLQNQPKINLPVSITPARIKTGDVNNLGIKELIGRGVSNFAGSTTDRVHNIKLAASRINGTLVAPGEIFSFNTTIGEISTSTGYTSAYIISKGRTILGEGGGVCQVSTTAFRAAVFAGLEIVERYAHAYRVRYYEQAGHLVGLDATIFIPTVDFKFKNDTANYILIQAYVKGVELYFDFHGTSDSREVEVSKPFVTNVRPAPPPLYEEDPTIPVGVTKQVDFQAVGATAEVRRTVKKDDQILYNDIFKSNYKPWQAVFKVGTKTQ